MPSYEHSIIERRDNNKFLMKEFQKAGFSKKQLIKLNRCRFYLHVETLSDITDGKGDQISTLSYTGHKTHYESQLHDWPVQVKPDEAHWTLWRKALRDSFKRTTVQCLGILAEPLGPWIDGKKEQWRWFFSEANSKIYYRTYNTPAWKVYKCTINIGQIRKRAQFRFESESEDIPEDAYRATITADQNNHNRYRLTGWAPENIPLTPTRCQQEEMKMHWMIDQIFNDTAENWIAQELRNNKSIMIVSDGSYHPKYEVGTAAWVITSETNTSRRLYGNNIVPGEAYLQCSHRSELCGLVGAVKTYKEYMYKI